MCSDIDEFVNVDDNVITCGVNVDPESLNNFSSVTRKNENSESDHNCTTAEATDSEKVKFDLTWEEVEKSLATLTRFCKSQTACTDKTFNLLSELRNNFRTMKFDSKNHEIKTESCF